jgi:chitinase
MVTLGGWTGSRYFSTNVGSAGKRTAFVKTVTDFATKYNLDGLDVEYVPKQHIP